MKKFTVLLLVVGTLIGCSSENEEMETFIEERSDEIAKQDEEFLKKGQLIAMQTQKVLGKSLVQVINKKGTEYALSFCNVRAIPLTDSMSVVQNAKIKRVSDKNRNPDNEASPGEMQYIRQAKEALSKGIPVTPQLITNENSYTGYYPILTNNMCLQCHGSFDTDISTGVSKKIKTLYPSDLATGYESNELRGIWVVEMEVDDK